MKKKVLGIIIGVLVAMPMFVNAAEVEKVDTVEKLRQALGNGKSVELTSNITLEDADSNAGGRSTGVAIKGSGDITIDGNGYTIDASKVRTTLEIYSNGEAVNVTLTDIKVNNGYAAGRAIDTRTGDIELTLDGATLTTTGSGNTQVLTIGDSYEGTMNINVLNSTISDGISGYGIIAFNKVNLTIDNSKVSGYGAIYLKPATSSKGTADSTVTIKNKSEISTNNVHSAATNAFGTIIFEDKNLTVNIENSTIKAVSTGEQPQYVFMFKEKENNKVTVSGNSNVIVDTKDELIAGEGAVTIKSGVTSNVEIPAECFEKEGEETTTGAYEIIDPETGNTQYIVASKDEVKETPIIEYSEIIAKEDRVKLLEELEKVQKQLADTVKELEAIENPSDEEKESLKMLQEIEKAYTELGKVLNTKEIVSFNEIIYGSVLNDNLIVDSEQTELQKAVKVTLDLPENLEKVKDGYTRKYSVIRFHINQDNSIDFKELEAIEKEGKVTFETDKFSTYILTYKDTLATKNPNTFDGISLYIMMATISLIGLVSLKIYTKKAKKY